MQRAVALDAFPTSSAMSFVPSPNVPGQVKSSVSLDTSSPGLPFRRIEAANRRPALGFLPSGRAKLCGASHESAGKWRRLLGDRSLFTSRLHPQRDRSKHEADRAGERKVNPPARIDDVTPEERA